MRISTIAFANLKRRKGKAMFLIVGIAIGIGTVVALLSLSGSIKEEIGAQLDRFGANIVVVPHSNSLTLDYGGIAVSGVTYDVHQLRNEDAKSILEIPYRNRLSIIAPKLLGAIEVEGQQVVLTGVDFKSELLLKRWWRITGQEPQGEQDLLMGYDVARSLSVIESTSGAAPQEVSEGGSHHPSEDQNQFRLARDRVQIAGRDYHIAGVINQTGGPEDKMIFGTLASVQTILGKPGQLSLIEVSALCKDCPVEDIVAQISEKLPHAKASAIQQSVKARTQTVDRLTRFSAAVSVVVLAIGALMIFTTMTGSVIERTKEIGVLRAIGFRRIHIIKGLMIEVTAISIIGGLTGWAAGMLASFAALPYFSETGIELQMNYALALFAIVAALAIGITSSIYPAIKASRLDPSEAVRYV